MRRRSRLRTGPGRVATNLVRGWPRHADDRRWTADPPRPGSSPATRRMIAGLVRLGLVALVAYLAWLAIGAFGRPYNFFDMKIYHGAVVWWANGNELYEFVAPPTTLGFTYPPFAALVMLPMAPRMPVAAGWSTAGQPRRAHRRSSSPCCTRSPTGWGGRSGSSWPRHAARRRPRAGPGDPRLRPGQPAAVRARSWPTWWPCAGGPGGALPARPDRRRRCAGSSSAAPGPAWASAWPPPSSSPRRCSSST